MIRVAMLLAMLAQGRAGTGTIFGSSTWDVDNPNSHLACATGEEIDDRAFIVAHNTLPCRSQVWIFNPRTGQSTLARVMDRGPRHAFIDMSPAVAWSLGHNGRERVVVVPIPPSRFRYVNDRHHRHHPDRKVRKKQRVA